MKDIVKWLRTIEERAFELYLEASKFFEEDKSFASFLRKLAEDESHHFHFMGSAAEFLRQSEVEIRSEIQLDDVTKAHVETLLERARELLANRDLTKPLMISHIVASEKSEWNAIFLYAINTLKDYSKLFQFVASEIQSHERRITSFLEVCDSGLNHLEEFRSLPKIWHPRILIAEDDEALRELLRDVLTAYGRVETAENGREALEKTRQRFFNVVVSDIGMPQMTGLEFYMAAREIDPGLRPHFVFCSGEIGADTEEFFKENNLYFLHKPFELNGLVQIVDRMLDTSVQPS